MPRPGRSATGEPGARRGPGAGLREQQKSRRRARLLAAGRTLFVEHGYAATSMEAIAAAAELGIATVYNYFGSKSKLLATILKEDFAVLYRQADELVAAPPADPCRGVLALVELYRRFEGNWQAKGMLAAVLGPGLTADPALDEVAREAEGRVRKQLAALLTHYRQAGRIRREINIRDAATVLFYVFNQHFIEYVTGQSTDFARMQAAMDRQLRFIVTAISG
ncbi:MAG: TetR/AcrR family transcriptional regulator [Gammaproteobacteria bacterium]|nr:TetR/AcrR family transcriptional regulator [Gammaproteobacteria bacterium]